MHRAYRESFSADSALAIKLLDYKKQLDIQTVDSLCAWIFAQTVLDLTPAGKLEDVIFIPPISKDAHHRYRLIKTGSVPLSTAI